LGRIFRLEGEGQRGVSKIDVAARTGVFDKRPAEKVRITGVRTDITVKLPVHLQINFPPDSSGTASAAASQDASRRSVDGVLSALAPKLPILREQVSCSAAGLFFNKVKVKPG
jgi:hypothetical protein